MKIFFSSQAKSDLVDIVEFIAEDNLPAAKKWVVSVKSYINRLENFPQLGRVVPEFSDESIREIIKGKYRIVYKIDEKNKVIIILTIHHSKQKL